MNYSGFMAGPDTEYVDLEDYISKALIPGFVNSLDGAGIIPTPQDVTKFKTFVKSSIYSRHTSKTNSVEGMPKSLPLVLKIKIDEKDIQTINILKKGDNYLTIDYMEIPYNVSPTQIDECDLPPECDQEIAITDCWERHLSFYTPSFGQEKPEEQPESNTAKLDEILKDLKSC